MMTTNDDKCPMCGYDDYDETFNPFTDEGINTCRRCGYQWREQTISVLEGEARKILGGEEQLKSFLIERYGIDQVDSLNQEQWNDLETFVNNNRKD